MAINSVEEYREKSEFYDKIGSWCLAGTCLLTYIFMATTWFRWSPGYHNQILKSATYMVIAIPGIATAFCGIASKRFELKSENKKFSDLLPWA